jgi:beta-xylosidase
MEYASWYAPFFFLSQQISDLVIPKFIINMINHYEIGGNPVAIEASESVAAIPENRTLLVERLTAEESINPEKVEGLSSIDQVFEHFKPQVDVEFQNEDGQQIKETFHFQNVSDFSVAKMTEQSSFLSATNTEKDFYEKLIKQLRSNKVLQRALENSESKEAFISALQQLSTELEEVL